jgi:cytochrome P450
VLDISASRRSSINDLDFIEFKDGVLHPTGDSLEEIDANMAAAGAKLREYFATFLTIRRAETEAKDDLISALIRSNVDGEPLSDLDLVNIMFLLMFAGLDTVTSSMSCIFAWLAQHPEERDRLVADSRSSRWQWKRSCDLSRPFPPGSDSRRMTSTWATAW